MREVKMLRMLKYPNIVLLKEAFKRYIDIEFIIIGKGDSIWFLNILKEICWKYWRKIRTV